MAIGLTVCPEAPFSMSMITNLSIPVNPCNQSDYQKVTNGLHRYPAAKSRMILFIPVMRAALCNQDISVIDSVNDAVFIIDMSAPEPA